MKAAGVLGGKSKGQVKQLSAEDKSLATLKDAVVAFSNTYKEGKYLCFATNVELNKNISVSASGQPFRKVYSNNSYRVTGSCLINFREKERDILRPAKKATFTLAFKDCLDGIGLPDTRLDSYDIKLK